MKFILLTFLMGVPFLVSANSLVRISADREELKDLTLKNHKPLESYNEARKFLFGTLHLNKDDKGYFVFDVYCGIKFRHDIGPGKIPSSNQVNTEHTWPQSKFSKSHSKSHQKADLHHLFPTDTKANGIRGNHHFTNVTHGYPAYKGCNLSHIGLIPETGRDGFEPPAEHKGNVARAIFYFAVRYDMEIPDYEEIVLKLWNSLDPVDEQELQRNNEIEHIQGNRNPFIDDSSLVDFISDY